MHNRNRARVAALSALLWTTVGGCLKSGGSDGSGDTADDSSTETDIGATEFVSADTSVPGARGGADLASSDDSAQSAAVADTEAEGGGENRSVERGDIYKVLDGDRILNLNRYRGLQVLNIGDPQKPVVEGQLAMSGVPVEMYVVAETAYVLMNNYQTYYGSRDDIQIESVRGGLVAAVDLSNPKQPVLLDQAVVEGYLNTSRLTTGDSGVALYVAATGWYSEAIEELSSVSSVAVAEGGATTVIKSFALDGSELLEKSAFELRGDISDIQATTEYMMVARNDYTDSGSRSTVTLVDISSPDGEMVEVDSVTTRGRVQNKFNMDIKDDVLRIVSGRDWNGTANHLETFDMSDPRSIRPIDHCEFGEEEDLYATLFIDNSAFFVTYFRTDPFHAFTIDEQGQCAEQSEFVVSGWNNFFRAVHDNTRLIGVGTNDENGGRTMAVSLYDITDLGNPMPLITRAEVALDASYSEGSWDDRAFSVVEGAASAQAEDGTEETGLVLLPFTGWNEGEHKSVNGVQIFTFSETTLTRRGVMEHEGEVRRSFLADTDLAANLSDQALSLHEVHAPDMPEERGRVVLAPNYRDVFAFGDYVARVRGSLGYYYYSDDQDAATVTVDVVKADADLDTAAAVASIQVPAAARIKQVGELLVSIKVTDTTNWEVKEPERSQETAIEVFDFSDPQSPMSVGTLVTDALSPGGSGGYYGLGLVADDCFDCGYYGGYYGSYDDGIFAVGSALVFAEPQQQLDSLGIWEECQTYPTAGGRACWSSSDGESGCDEEWAEGVISCLTPEGGEETCEGEIQLCTESGCEPADSSVRTETECYTDERFRYWTSFDFEVLDLSEPSKPTLGETIELPQDVQGTSVFAAGDSIYYNYQTPIDARDGKPLVKRYVRLLEVSDPSEPELGAAINIPGEVIATDGSSLYTRDVVWRDDSAEVMVARLTLDNELATLEAQHVWAGREVSSIALDGAGHVLVTHNGRYDGYLASDAQEHENVTKLTLLDSETLDPSGEVTLDSWGSFQTAKAGRAVFSVPGGILIMNTEDAGAPHAQAYFPTTGGGEMLLLGNDLVFAAGPHGIYRFDLDESNLRSGE